MIYIHWASQQLTPAPADNLQQQTIVMVFMFNTHITLDYGYNIHWSWTCHWRRTTNVPFLRTATQHVHRYLDDVKHKARASTDICLCQRPGFLHTWLAKAETRVFRWCWWRSFKENEGEEGKERREKKVRQLAKKRMMAIICWRRQLH